MTGAAARRGVCLNVHGAQNADFWDRGIARYIAEHAGALLTAAPALVHTVRASPNLGFTPSLLRLLPSGKVRRTHAEPLDADGAAPALYHVMSPLEWGHPLDDIWPLWARAPDVSLAVTLYDLIPLLFPERYIKTAFERVAYEARVGLVRRADHVFAISSHTADDAMRELGIPAERISVIDAGASQSFGDAWPRREDADAYVRGKLPAIDRDFAFYVGGMDERKNLPGLISAWALLPAATRERTQLVITCGLRDDQRAQLERHAARHGLRPGEVQLTGRVSDRELAALYRACRLFVFASLYEGSGLPILEAMTAEAPVVAASTSTGPEILGEAEGTFDPADPADMARVIDEALRDPERLERYRERSRTRIGRFSWTRVAERTAEGYATALERRRPARRRVRPARPRIALLAPAGRSGRAADDAVERLAAALRARADVDLIASAGEDRLGPSGHELRRGLGAYDRTVHVLGAEPAHRHAFEALLRDPGGTAVFEHVQLGPFHRWYAGQAAGALWLRGEIERQYDAMVPGWIAGRGVATAEEEITLGMMFTRELQQAASRVVAPCRLAADMLAMDRRGEAFPAPIDVLAPLAPAPRDAVADAPPDAPLLVAAEGPGAPGAELLVGALALLRAARPNATLSLLGPADEDDRERLLALAREAGVAGAVELPRGLTPAMRAARVTGAAVALLPVPAVDADRIAFAQESLAAGVPVLGAALGWADEAPGDGIVRLPDNPTAAQVALAVDAVLGDAAGYRELREGALAHARAAAAGTPAQAWLELLELA